MNGGSQIITKRKDITIFLNQLLISSKFTGIGKYWSQEVCLDYGSVDVKRIDFLQFEPNNQVNIDGIEKGIFTCYEVKSCKADFKSGFGKNFIGEKNYFVMPMSTYKEVIQDIPHNVGVMVPIPEYGDKMEEFEHPTKLSVGKEWKLITIKQAHIQGRKRPMTELLFCMLRSARNN